MLEKPQIDVVHLLPILDDMLIGLLQSLTEADWQKQTVAKMWKVKDVVAHLLDGNIRILSMLRDEYYGEQAPGNSIEQLLPFLNRLNADWVTAMKRVSPDMLILLHQATGKLYCDYYTSLDPLGVSPFAVNWAGESESRNWMHIAREYTEKWLHQQQIRDAVGLGSILMNDDLFRPFMEIFMFALPYTYRDVNAENETVIKLTIEGDTNYTWYITRTNERWLVNKQAINVPATQISIPAGISWKLFSKSIRYEDAANEIDVKGDFELGKPALAMISVMA